MSLWKSLIGAALTTSARPVPKPVRAPVAPVAPLPTAWLDNARMDRVIFHWTGGSNVASSLDKEHYHFVVEIDDRKPRVVRGLLPVKANTPPLREGEYAAHTRGTNSYSIGISLCGMGGAKESPFDPGKYPVTEGQFQLAAEVTAQLCKHYKIPVTARTVLSHAEVQPTLGIKQKGKWDISRVVFNLMLKGGRQVGDEFRERVRTHLAKL